MGLLGGCLPWWVFARRELTSALLVLMGVLRLPWRRLVWRVSCDCLGAAWSGERLAFALALLGLASAPRVPWNLSAGGVVAGVSPGGLPWECPAFDLALLGLASALRLPWHLSAWRSCEVLACDSDLVRQGRGLPYKTGLVKGSARQGFLVQTGFGGGLVWHSRGPRHGGGLCAVK